VYLLAFHELINKSVDFNVGVVDFNVGVVDFNVGVVDFNVGAHAMAILSFMGQTIRFQCCPYSVF